MEEQGLGYLKLIDQSHSNEQAIKMKTGLSSYVSKYSTAANKISDISYVAKESLEHSFSKAMKTVAEHQLPKGESNIIYRQDKTTDRGYNQGNSFRSSINNNPKAKSVDSHFSKTVIQITDERRSQIPMSPYSYSRNEVDSSNLSLRQDLLNLNSKRKLLTRTAVSKNSHRILMMPHRFHLTNPSLSNDLMANKDKINNSRPATTASSPRNKAKVVFQSDKKDNIIFHRNSKVLPAKSGQLEQGQGNGAKSNLMFPIIRHHVMSKNRTRFIFNHKSEQKNSYSNLRSSSCVPSASSGVFRLNPAPITKELKQKILLEKELYEADFAKEIEVDKVLQALDLSGELELG